jgi:hypothetical protein
LIPNYKSAVIYPEDSDLGDVLKSLDVIVRDLKNRYEESKRKREVLEVIKNE